MSEWKKYPTRCKIVEADNQEVSSGIITKTPDASKPHIGKTGLAEDIPGRCSPRITLDDGTILWGYECWWIPLHRCSREWPEDNQTILKALSILGADEETMAEVTSMVQGKECSFVSDPRWYYTHTIARPRLVSLKLVAQLEEESGEEK